MLSRSDSRPFASIRGASLIFAFDQRTVRPSRLSLAPARGTKVSLWPKSPVWTVTHSGWWEVSFTYTVPTLPSFSPWTS
jgi:hypothetical protein